MPAVETSSYRRADLSPGPEAVLLSSALEMAARCVDRPVSALDALHAAEAELGRPEPDRPWLEVARSVACALSLQPDPFEASARELMLRGGTALGRSPDGGWLLVQGRRGRRLRVTLIDIRGQRTQLLTPAQLDRLLGESRSWLRLEPLLALDPIARADERDVTCRAWSRLRSFMKIERRELWVVVIYAMVIGALTLATPIAVQALVNTIAFGAVLQPLVVLTILLSAGLLFSALLAVLEAFVVEVLQRRVFVRVAEDFGRRLPTIEAEVHDRKYVPELTNRFFDVLTIQKSMSTLLLDGLSLALQTTLGMLLLSFYHPLLLGFSAVLVVLLATVVATGRGASRTASLESKAKYATAAWLEDVARLPTLFKGARASEHAAQRTEMLCRNYLAARRTHYRVLLRQIAGGQLLQVLAIVSLLGVGGWLVIDRQLTLGQLVAAELVIGAIAAGFAKLGKNLEKVYDLAIGLDKLGTLVDLPTERRGGQVSTAAGPASLCLRQVTVGRGPRSLLRGAELHVAPGDRIQLTGAAASGKSTLLDTLGGLRPPMGGTVLVDRLDLRRADLHQLRDRVVVVRGHALMNGSILDNLGLSSGPLHEPVARELLALVDLEKAIDALPQGLDTPLVPSGAPLSRSQLRRLVLARALAARPRALLLDGALDGLGLPPDALSSLLDHVLGPDAPWSVVVVSNDPQVAARCDRTLRIEAHDLVEVT
ncbi:MAG: ATP-binding cassette domain-containing protein [Myxococcota bacterium]